MLNKVFLDRWFFGKGLQYIDTDFDNEFVNLNQLSDIQDKSTVKIIPLSDAPDFNLGKMNQSGEETSSSSSDTIIISSPETSRSHWPTKFQIPKFPYDVELQLQSATQAFISDGVLLNPSHKMKSDILGSLAEQIIKFKVYPTNWSFS